jgi:predicted ATP-dependent endonuclease of OLD family
VKLQGFRITMYRSVLDSDWIDVDQLAVLVGKNESGKTGVLKGLHKFNPFKPEPYSMDRDWPRGHRKDRNDKQVVCSCRFSPSTDELAELAKITDKPLGTPLLEVTKDYGGRFEVHFPDDLFPDRLHPNDVDRICESLPTIPKKISEAYSAKAQQVRQEVARLAHEGRFTDLVRSKDQHNTSLRELFTQGDGDPEKQQREREEQFVTQFVAKLDEVGKALKNAPSIQKKAHEYVIQRLPTFIYMSDYRTFTGSAQLDQVKQRVDGKKPTEEDRTLLTIMELSGLDLNEEVEKGNQQDREQRQYDLDDASETLTREISDRWRQRRYEVQLRADGQYFFTFVKDEHDPSLIRLEERSKGFQWFFSFDLMFMYESRGTFKGCVLLLDEPGLHLHPDAQKDLLKRIESYSGDNTLIYSTHLPFMIDLRKPETIRVISESSEGTIVSDDLTNSQPEAKFVLQAALGMSGSASYLLAEKNLVVEGVDDFWLLTELSRLLERSTETHLSDDVFVTPAGGASEAGYIGTIMIGQDLDVVVLLDSDSAGDNAREKLVKRWLTRYKSKRSAVLSLGEVIGRTGECSIEDLFPDDFYLERVHRAYAKQLASAGQPKVALQGTGQLCKRVERAFEALGLTFNKGSVAKVLKGDLSGMKDASVLPQETRNLAKKVFTAIASHFEEPKENGA